MSPDFQRREAWTVKAKSLLVESILLNFPVPAVTLAERRDNSTFIVVDGKQRLTTLTQFLGELHGSQFNEFKLSGLTQITRLNGMSYKDICLQYPKDASVLENYPIRTNIIRGWKNDEVLFSVFHRLNSGSVKLSPQELRQSLRPGKFISFISAYCEESPALRSIFPGSEPDFRMRDVELAIRFISLALFISEYAGDLKRHLDTTVQRLNDEWDVRKNDVAKILARMEDGYQASVNAFGLSGVYRKWNGTNWEARTNRAVFDSIMFVILNDGALKAFNVDKLKVVDAFKAACSVPAFRDAVEKTTKTTEALFARINVFAEELTKAGIDAPQLSLVNNRIVVVKI